MPSQRNIRKISKSAFSRRVARAGAGIGFLKVFEFFGFSVAHSDVELEAGVGLALGVD